VILNIFDGQNNVFEGQIVLIFYNE